MNQALELIKETNPPIGRLELAQLCDAGHCNAYIEYDDCEGYQIKTSREVQASGYHKVVNVVNYMNRFEGSYLVGQVEGEENIEWIPKREYGYFGEQLLFKPIDIYALIEKTNETHNSKPVNKPPKPEFEDSRERTSYERLVYVLVKKAGYDLDSDTGRNNAITSIRRFSSNRKLNAPSRDTLKKMLKAASERAKEDREDREGN